MCASFGKPLRSNESVLSVERMLSRGNVIEIQKIQYDRHSLYVYLEQKAELHVEGEYSAQTRLSEAAADMEVRKWEKRRFGLTNRPRMLSKLIPGSPKIEFESWN